VSYDNNLSRRENHRLMEKAKTDAALAEKNAREARLREQLGAGTGFRGSHAPAYTARSMRATFPEREPEQRVPGLTVPEVSEQRPTAVVDNDKAKKLFNEFHLATGNRTKLIVEFGRAKGLVRPAMGFESHEAAQAAIDLLNSETLMQIWGNEELQTRRSASAAVAAAAAQAEAVKREQAEAARLQAEEDARVRAEIVQRMNGGVR
jgi:hypothetical protein